MVESNKQNNMQGTLQITIDETKLIEENLPDEEATANQVLDQEATK